VDNRDVEDAFGVAVLFSVVVAGVTIGRKIVKSRMGRKTIHVAVLGERGTGKTTLLRTLAGRATDGRYEPTQSPEEIPATEITVDEQRYLVRETFDVSGSTDAYQAWWWSAASKRSLVYLVDARRLADVTREPFAKEPERLKRDAEQIAFMLQKKGEPKDWRCVIAVTHRDEDPRFGSASSGRPYVDLIGEDLRDVIFTLGGHSKVRITSGSLRPESAGKELIMDIIRLLDSRNP
jgi:hypothetical protein